MSDKSVTPSDKLLLDFCPVAGIKLLPQLMAHQAEDVFILWEEWEKESESIQDVPHWGVVWPAAILAAEWILSNRLLFQDKTILEIGCGGAVASIAAKLSGAREAVSNDIDPVALTIAGKNAEANQVKLVLDNSDYLNTGAIPEADIILIADFFYKKADSVKLLDHLYQWKAGGIQIFITDGGRTFAPKNYQELLFEETIPVNSDLEGVDTRNVRLLRL